MVTLDNKTLAAILRERFNPSQESNDERDILFAWIIDELEGNYENATA